MFFDNGSVLLRTLVVGSLAYVALVCLLRISGKRTLSKMNAFDMVVTVALGSTLATILLSKDVALAEGVLALALLIFLQYAVAWASAHWRPANTIVKSQPAILFYRGQFLREAMTRERVTEGEVLSAVREQGFAMLEDVEAVVLESTGTLSALGRTSGVPASTLGNVRNRPGPPG